MKEAELPPRPELAPSRSSRRVPGHPSPLPLPAAASQRPRRPGMAPDGFGWPRVAAPGASPAAAAAPPARKRSQERFRFR